jgi:hypothetical protein
VLGGLPANCFGGKGDQPKYLFCKQVFVAKAIGGKGLLAMAMTASVYICKNFQTWYIFEIYFYKMYIFKFCHPTCQRKNIIYSFLIVTCSNFKISASNNNLKKFVGIVHFSTDGTFFPYNG